MKEQYQRVVRRYFLKSTLPFIILAILCQLPLMIWFFGMPETVHGFFVPLFVVAAVVIMPWVFLVLFILSGAASRVRRRGRDWPVIIVALLICEVLALYGTYIEMMEPGEAPCCF